MALALKKAGNLFPYDLDKNLDYPPKNEDLPDSLKDTRSSIQRIFQLVDEDGTDEVDQLPSTTRIDNEYAKAARSGVELSNESLRKLRELENEDD